MSAARVVVAGATGALGRPLVDALRESGYRVCAIGRDQSRLVALNTEDLRVADLTQPATLRGACDGADVLISCAGARMTLAPGDPAGFMAVDYRGNRALLGEAKRAGVRKFVYVSLAGALALRRTEYARAHEMFASDLAVSGLPHTIVRPSGFFHMFGALLDLAARNMLAIPGDGFAKTNPIHEADAARACVDAISTGDTSLTVGGPEVFTRLRIAEMAFEALGRAPNVRHLPVTLGKAISGAVRWWNPRLAGLIEFGAAVNGIDIIAPAYGSRRLGDYLRARAAERRS